MKRFFFFLFALVLIMSCRDRNRSFVPDIPVNIAINVNEPAYFNLTVVSGWVYITGGSRGIIVYRKGTGEFVALERHSTFQPEDACSVVVKEDGIIIEDPCSGSQWLITDGSLVNGPASFPLVQYDTQFSDPFLYITN